MSMAEIRCVLLHSAFFKLLVWPRARPRVSRPAACWRLGLALILRARWAVSPAARPGSPWGPWIFARLLQHGLLGLCWPLAGNRQARPLLGGSAAQVLFCLGSSSLPGEVPRGQGRCKPACKGTSVIPGRPAMPLTGSLTHPGGNTSFPHSETPAPAFQGHSEGQTQNRMEKWHPIVPSNHQPQGPSMVTSGFWGRWIGCACKSAVGLSRGLSPRKQGVHPVAADGSRPPWSGRTGPRLGMAASGLDLWHPQNFAVPCPALLWMWAQLGFVLFFWVVCFAPRLMQNPVGERPRSYRPDRCFASFALMEPLLAGRCPSV